jgi:hypothetical protein
MTGDHFMHNENAKESYPELSVVFSPTTKQPPGLKTK